MPSPWYSGKKTDSVPLKAGVPVSFGEIRVDLCPAKSWALVSGNAKLRLTSKAPVKLDLWLDRVTAKDQTGYASHTFPGGTDDFFLWPVWMGEVEVGETYRWWVRLENGMSGTLSTRYAKGILLPATGSGLSLDKFST